MEPWIPITLVAALTQTSRTAIQRHMKGQLGDYGASAIRFIYAVPFAWVWFLAVWVFSNQNIPVFDLEFALWSIVGGVSQIFFTVFLIKLFSYKNFLVGVALSKFEVLLAAIIEASFFSAIISTQFSISIAVGIISMLFLSLRTNIFTWTELRSSLYSKSTILGLLSATSLAVSVVSFRTAINTFSDTDFVFRASVTAAIVIVGQALGLIVFLYISRRTELKAAFTLWKPGMAAGFLGAVSTAAWFSAFALQRAAPVRAVGQSELLFALAFTVFVFHQRLTKVELVGVFLLIGSILLVILN